MTCSVTDEEFSEFLGGTSIGITDHVATCELCQDRLAGSIAVDDRVVEGTMRAIRVSWTGQQLLQLMFDVGSRYTTAISTYVGKTR